MQYAGNHQQSRMAYWAELDDRVDRRDRTPKSKEERKDRNSKTPSWEPYHQRAEREEANRQRQAEERQHREARWEERKSTLKSVLTCGLSDRLEERKHKKEEPYWMPHSARNAYQQNGREHKQHGKGSAAVQYNRDRKFVNTHI